MDRLDKLVEQIEKLGKVIVALTKLGLEISTLISVIKIIIESIL